MEFFEAPRASAGPIAVTLRFDTLELEISGLDDGLAGRLRARFGTFAHASSVTAQALRVTLRREERDYFIPAPKRAEFNHIVLACEGHRVRYVGHQVAGWFETRGTQAGVLLSRGTYETTEGALENYIRAAVAWRAAERGGALVHAASAVLDGRGYLFFGPSGAGKSTLSACNRRARVVSDDLSLILPGSDGGLDLVGSPFRGTYTEGDPVHGRFPLAAGFRLVQSPTVEVRHAPRLLVLSELIGNLPFVAEAFDRRPDLFEGVEEAFRGLPLARLHFRKDDSYWDAIDRAGL